MRIRHVIPRDAIPSVENPSFDDEYAGRDDDRVVVVESEDRPRAYPLRYLQFHEIVNDTVDGEPLAITWCPLCGSAVVYERTHGGTVLEFGVSGKLADDDLVMYDRETESEWKQSSGVCIDGPLADGELDVRPAPIITWGGVQRIVSPWGSSPTTGWGERGGEYRQYSPRDRLRRNPLPVVLRR
jgi:hypothetical protein